MLREVDPVNIEGESSENYVETQYAHIQLDKKDCNGNKSSLREEICYYRARSRQPAYVPIQLRRAYSR